MKVLVTHSCPTLCNPMDCSLPGSFVQEILQARILDHVAMPSSRGSSQLRDRTWVLHCRQILYCLESLFQQAPWTLLKFMSTESVTLSNHLIFCCPLLLCLQSFPALGSFPGSQLFSSGGQSISPSNEYLGSISFKIIGLISLLSKGLLRVLSSITV